MLRHKRRKFRVLSNSPDSTQPIHINAHDPGSPARVNGTMETPQVAKKISTPNISQIIEQRTWENEQLRKELIYQQRKNGVSMYLLEEVKLVVKSLRKALENFQQCNLEIENECMGREVKPDYYLSEPIL